MLLNIHCVFSHISDQLTPPERALDSPLRMSVTDVFKSIVGGATIACTVVCGSVQIGDKIMLMPGAEVGTVKCMFHLRAVHSANGSACAPCVVLNQHPVPCPAIEVNSMPAKWAAAGDHISIVANGIDIAHVRYVLCALHVVMFDPQPNSCFFSSSCAVISLFIRHFVSLLSHSPIPNRFYTCCSIVQHWQSTLRSTKAYPHGHAVQGSDCGLQCRHTHYQGLPGKSVRVT